MDILDQPHWETVSPPMRALLSQIGQCEFASRFYLAGETALALQIGHRRSVDLDFFSATDLVQPKTHQEILRQLGVLHPQIIEQAFGNFVVMIDNIAVGFFSYGYPLVGQSVQVENVRLASRQDIGLMKLDSLISRGSRKDFYDVYFITQDISLNQLLELGQVKYSTFRDFSMLVFKNMVLFDNADSDLQPELLMSVEWDVVKRFFVEQAKILRQQWFGF